MDTVIGVLGGGQLGRMLAQAASPLSIPLIFLDPDEFSPAKQVISSTLLRFNPPLNHVTGPFTDSSSIRKLAAQVDILTIEIEHVDVDALELIVNEFESTGGRSGKGIKVFPAPEVIRTIQDKFLQKTTLASRGIPHAPFNSITSDDPSSSDFSSLKQSILNAGNEFGYPLMLKSRHLAYDGRGNHVLRSSSDEHINSALDFLLSTPSKHPLSHRLYVEKFAPFIMEVAVMVVRSPSGEIRTYPAVETIHRENVCHIVYAPLRPPKSAESGVGNKQRGKSGGEMEDLGDRAREEAKKAVEALGDGAVGVFGVEMFLMSDG